MVIKNLEIDCTGPDKMTFKSSEYFSSRGLNR